MRGVFAKKTGTWSESARGGTSLAAKEKGDVGGFCPEIDSQHGQPTSRHHPPALRILKWEFFVRQENTLPEECGYQELDLTEDGLLPQTNLRSGNSAKKLQAGVAVPLSERPGKFGQGKGS